MAGISTLVRIGRWVYRRWNSKNLRMTTIDFREGGRVLKISSPDLAADKPAIKEILRDFTGNSARTEREVPRIED